MANYPINPYGQNTEMPEGYPIADNLSTDSAQQALSARQGKKLGDFISTEEEVDTSSVSEITGIITAPTGGNQGWNNVWVANSSYKAKLIPVTVGKKYHLVGNGIGTTYYAVLANSTLTEGSSPNYATGTTQRTELGKDDSAYVEIPSDGVYLYVHVKSNDSDREPSIFIKKSDGLNKVIDDAFNELGSKSIKKEIVVAAADAPEWQKANADFVCDGVNDELTIQAAIDSLYGTGGRIRLTRGEFIIDSFPKDRAPNANRVYTDSESGDSHRYAAIMLPQNGKSYIIEGDTFRLKDGSGTKLRVSDTCYTSLGANDLRVVLAAAYPSDAIDQIKNNVSLTMSNITIQLPWNQKPIMCIDMMFVAKVYLQFINCVGYISGSVPSGGTTVDLINPCPKAVQHCVGLRSTGGSNWGTCNDYRNVGVSGFYEGFKFSGEHVVGINLSAILCVYGYTFGNFTFTHASMHPMTLINCCDERCYNGPYFATQSGNQQIDLLQWNMEIGNSYITGGEGRGVAATEKVPGTFRGRVEYTITRGDSDSAGHSWSNQPWDNDVAAPFWEDGHGHGFISRNMAHLPACTTSVRNTYKPDYMERIWDTTLGKEVICVDETNRVWKDAAGNTV